MKKIMWAISIVSLAGTAVVLQFMPENVPMHYDMSGNIDRWGSKYENLIFPAIIILLSLFWTLFMGYFDKKDSALWVHLWPLFLRQYRVSYCTGHMLSLFPVKQNLNLRLANYLLS